MSDLGSWRGRPTWAEIDLGALKGNVKALKGHIGPGCQLLAVVKANAYGHGAPAVARAVLEAGASCLGVACPDEGVELRLAGIQAPILILGYTSSSEAEKVISHSLTPTVNSLEQAEAVARAAQALGRVTPVHLKVDTGMNRFGLDREGVLKLAGAVGAMPALRLEGAYTHFACADEEDKSFTLHQFEEFLAIVDRLDLSLRHVANSAAVLDLPQTALDMVRPGIALYGLYPSAAVSRSVPLKPVLSLKSRVARVNPLAAGETVSYGRTWTARSPSRIALMPCGYADGLPRLLSNRGSVLLRGQRAPIVGRICMDLTMADVTDIEGVAEGDEVVIIGTQGQETIAAEEIAAQAGTISYEVLCGISRRVPRIYHEGGKVVAVKVMGHGAES
ncbi:MAG: alanine racemase [Dehalococcoidia bacterium]|nr:alanine racemase [Dehalococcoidia bacterium]